MLYGSALALVISAFLPWATVLGAASGHLGLVGVAGLIVIAGIYVRAANVADKRQVTKALMIVTWVANTVMVLVLTALFYDFRHGNTAGLVGPSVGLYIATFATLSALFATIQLHRS
jgi:hypothetical protein